MSIYSCNISNVSRAKGSSSCATLSYITAEKIREERTGNLYNYGRNERVLYTGTIIPETASEKFSNAETLFNSIENFEKAENARTAKKIMVALPREFDGATQREVIEEFIKQNITSKQYACTYAIHTDKKNNNPHAHILIANRQINAKGEWSTKSKKEYALDEKGERIPLLDENGKQKLGKRKEKLWKRVSVQVNPLDKKETLVQLREQWAEVCNRCLPQEKQIDHRSYKEQGEDIIPTIHEGWKARKMGFESDRITINDNIRKANTERSQLRIELEDAGKMEELIREQKERVSFVRPAEKPVERTESAPAQPAPAKAEEKRSIMDVLREAQKRAKEYNAGIERKRVYNDREER